MKIVIQTQVRENYGAHDWDGKGECPQYWKCKGGDTYVVRNLSVTDGLRCAQYMKEIAPLIETRSESFEEYILDWRLADDSESDGCAEWETPWTIDKQDDGGFVAFREVLNEEYGYMRADIAKKVEQYRMNSGGNRNDYDARYYMRDGSQMDAQGNIIDLVA